MILRRGDKISKLLTMMGAGLVSEADYLKLLKNSGKANFKNHLSWTLEEFDVLSQQASDIDLVKTVLQIEKSKLKFGRMNINEYFQVLKYVGDGVQDINNGFASIEFPPLSSEQLQAGFGGLDFGILGLARTISEFARVDGIAVYNLQIHFILKTLAQLSQVRWAEKKHNDIIISKQKTK